MLHAIHRWAAGAWKNGFVRSLLAVIGFFAALIPILQVALPDGTRPVLIEHRPFLIASSAVVALLTALAQSWPGGHQVWRAGSMGDWQIEICRGDLFDQPAPVLVTVNRKLDTTRSVVGSDALVAQLVERWFA